MALANKLNQSINNFKYSYFNVLELQEFYFQPNLIKKPKHVKNLPILDLVLKSKITNHIKYLDNTVQFCAKYFTNKIMKKYLDNNTQGYHEENKLVSSWHFDIRKKSNTAYWFASEAEDFLHGIIRHCYSQPVISFNPDDFIEIKINIFSKSGILNCESLVFSDVNITKFPKDHYIDYSKSLYKSDINFDNLRCCELENLVHVWKNEKSLTRKTNLDDFKKYFTKNFEIIDIVYDFFKFYVFKVTMKAFKIGIIKKNKFTNWEICIKEWEDTISNETQCFRITKYIAYTKEI